MIGRLKKLAGYRLLLLLSHLIIILLINPVTMPTFSKVTIDNGVLYGYIIDIINHANKLVVLAIGMTLMVSASAEADISTDTVMAVFTAAYTKVLAGSEVSVNECANPYILAVLATLAMAIVCGDLDGFLIAKFKIQPMVAALIPFTTGKGISQLVTDGQITYIRMDEYKLLGNNIPGVPIPTPAFVAVIMVTPIYILLNKMTMGMCIRSVGINEGTSRLMGLKPVRVAWVAYTLCGLCAEIAGLVAFSRIYSTDANNIDLNMELDVIAAVALGDNSLGGGRLSLLGSVIGVYTIQALITTPYAMSVPADQIPVYKTTVAILIVTVQSGKLKRFRKHLASRHTSGDVERGVA